MIFALIFVTFFYFVNFVIFELRCIDSGYLVMATRLQFYSGLF